MKLTFPAIIYPSEDGGYTVEVPDLPGCIAHGDTLANAIFEGTNAASGWVLGELEDGNSIPPARTMASMQPESRKNGVASLLAIDIEEYAKKHGTNVVQKVVTLTMPAWLYTFAESQHINFSQLVQEALAKKHRLYNE